MRGHELIEAQRKLLFKSVSKDIKCIANEKDKHTEKFGWFLYEHNERVAVNARKIKSCLRRDPCANLDTRCTGIMLKITKIWFPTQ